ncbi:PREDICTED: cysteine-rich secretory protein 3-like [Miniopterus natalensis]|uniref:cysteine-rich secretory protein 3-like n=1 Tax=Miniopterus natalensis TaxID=291302 RepID=UPI0007A7014C|nr:PREDICTED: cysteine-rich secretory protein 3-like [Miniopterus natalensis]
MASPSASNMLKMTWSDEAARNAESWANMCTMTHSPSAKRHISSTGCGENLFMSSNPRSWSDAIQSLYDEVKDFKYGFGSTRPNAVTGHYTQLVWATSHQLGCALAHCPRSIYKYFYVCQYCPSGNVLNTIKTPYKKGKPCEDCPHHCDNGLCIEGEAMAVSLEKGPSNAIIKHSMSLLSSLHSKKPGPLFMVTDRSGKNICGLLDTDLKLMLISKDLKYHHGT